MYSSSSFRKPEYLRVLVWLKAQGQVAGSGGRPVERGGRSARALARHRAESAYAPLEKKRQRGDLGAGVLRERGT